MADAFARVGVVGAGAWGTALAQAAARAGREVILWAREDEVVASVNEQHVNSVYLPDAPLEKNIRATSDLLEAAACDVILMVTPAQFMRDIAASMADQIKPNTPVLIASKGIEISSLKMMSDVGKEALPNAQVGILSGPTFAIEVALGLPAALTLAIEDSMIGEALSEALSSEMMRIYWTDDVTGAQIGGAVKNVLAIACGVVEGRKMGANTRAALITRGMAEISRLAVRLGARSETLMGLSGLGDLTLTCSSEQSRNMSLGMRLGKGETLEQIMGSRKTVSEGVYTAQAVSKLADELKIDMPICQATNAILNKGADVESTIKDLLNRPLRAEHG